MEQEASLLSSKNLKDIEALRATSPKLLIIKEYKNLLGLKIGDVLIRFPKRDGVELKDVNTVTLTCKVPNKFKVVFIDQDGVPWLKQIQVKGGLAKNIVNPVMHAEVWSYKIDPRQTESIILDIKYDPREEYKTFRKNNPNYGGSSKHE